MPLFSMFVLFCYTLHTFILSSVLLIRHTLIFCFFFFNDTATTEIYTLSLHDALPICVDVKANSQLTGGVTYMVTNNWADRKSTRLNSSHVRISYAVFCLKKKKKKQRE